MKRLSDASQKSRRARILLHTAAADPDPWNDWAGPRSGGLAGGRYKHCERVMLVGDNLNPHTKGAFYKVFEPARARALARCLEFRYTRSTGAG